MLLFVMNKTRKNKYIIIIYRHVHTDYLNILILLTEIGIRGGLAVLSIELYVRVAGSIPTQAKYQYDIFKLHVPLNILRYH